MDNLNSTSDNASPQTSIVSSLASATPITSEIVSDTFESDTKFEITTLEKASYEDLYTESNSTEQTDMVQPVESAINEEDDNSQPDDGEKQSRISNGDQITLATNEKQNTAAEPEQTKVTLTEEPKANKAQECPAVVCEPVADSVETNSKTISETTQAKPQTDNPQAITPDNSNDRNQGSETHEPESCDAPEEQGNPLSPKHEEQLEQPSAIGALSADGGLATDPAEQATHTNPLSHTSVDAQMEKVIENIVELGGPHQFSQALTQDRDKVLENIRREISEDRSSIDLIAEVASKQQSIELGPLDQYKQREKMEADSKRVKDRQPDPPVVESTEITDTQSEPPAVETEDTKDTQAEPPVVESEGIQDTQSDSPAIKTTKDLDNTQPDPPAVESADIKDTQPDPPAVQPEDINSTKLDPPAVDVQPQSSEPSGRPSRSLRTRTPKKPIEMEPLVVEQPKKQARKSRGLSEDSNKSHALTKNPPSIKLPHKSRQTISVSDPATRVLKRGNEEETPEVGEEPPKKQVRRSRGATDDHNNSYEATKSGSGLKLTLKSRQTISVSDPVTRPGSNREASTSSKRADPVQAEKKYTCHDCGYATDRLNNLVYHTKTFCQGKCQIGEVMKADIIRQQQQAKNKKKR